MINFNFSSFPVLTTQRLTLRSLTPADASAIRDLRSNEQVNRHLDRPKSISLEEAANFIKKINNGIADNEWIYWAIALKKEDFLIGTICLWNISKEEHRGEAGFELHPGFQGRGLMQEALMKVTEFGFREMGLHAIQACTKVENKRSGHLLKKCNFIRMTGGEKEVASGEVKYILKNTAR